MTVTVATYAPVTPTAYTTFTTAQNVMANLLYVPANVIDTASGPIASTSAQYQPGFIHVRAGGVFSTTGTPTFVAGITALQAGTAITLAANGAFTTASGASNLSWEIDWYGVADVRGSGGQLTSTGFGRFASTASAATVVPYPTTTPQTALLYAFNEPAEWSIYWTWSASSASNSVSVNYMIIEAG